MSEGNPQNPQQDESKSAGFFEQPLLNTRQVGIAAAFGGAALAIVLAGLVVPIPGTIVVTDPREIFTTIGSALSGPIGGLIVGFLAGIAEPGIPLASIPAHMISGLYMGLAYKQVYKRLEYPKLLVGWAILVIIYYYLVIVPLFTIFVATIYMGDPGQIGPLYVLLVVGATPETIFTTVVTTVIMSVIPPKFRKPVW